MAQISFFEPAKKLKSFVTSKKTQILSILEDCHNYIYANEGVLKEKAFREIIKILFLKIYSEKHIIKADNFFTITKTEYDDIFKNRLCKSFDNRINRLYQILSQKSSLNIWTEKPLISKKAIAYIVNRLQSICLNNISGDIAGQAFQTFIHHHQRGERGEFFTPNPVVQLAVQIIQPKYNERLIDPACGSGGFLLSSIRYVEKANLHKKTPVYVKHNIYGIEFNPDVAWSAKLLLETEGGQESNIMCANSLDIDEQDNSFDIVLTNPPFGRRGKVEEPAILKKYDLGKRWHKKKNNSWYKVESILSSQPPEVLFIEKCLKLLKPEGRMAIVLPDGLLQNPSLSFVRHWITTKASITGIISLPPETFVPFGTGVKTSLLFLRKSFQKKQIFFSKIRNIDYSIKENIPKGHDFPVPSKKDHLGTLALTSCKVKTGQHTTNHPHKTHNINNILQNLGQTYKNSDIDQAISVFHNKKQVFKSNSIAWRLKADMLRDRWDAEHYSLKDMQMMEKLKSAKTLSKFTKIVRQKENLQQYTTSSFIKYVAISDIDRHGMKIVSHQNLFPHQLPSRASYKIQEGDILLAVSGANTGTERQALALVSKDYDGAICSNGFAVLRSITNIDKYFLLAFFKTDIFIKQVRRMMTGHAIPCISLTNLGQIMVSVPNKHIQAKIAKRTKQIITLSQQQQEEINDLKKDLKFI